VRCTNRPLPKRNRSAAGLEDIDAWLGQIANNSTTTSRPPLSPVVPAASVPPHGGAASRKRHHSLPASVLAGSFQAFAAASSSGIKAEPTSTKTSTVSAFPRRPELALFASESFLHPHTSSTSSPFSNSNQYSPSLRQEPHQFDATYSFLQQQSAPAARSPDSTSNNALSLPEMSPREDFLVRAFMKLEGGCYDDTRSSDGAFSYPPPQAPLPPPPLEIQSAAADEGGDQDDGGTASKTPTAGHHKWSRDEDDKLRDTVSRFGGKSWKLIAETMGNGRTDVQCLHRWNKVLKPGLVKGPWTPEEDRILLSLIARYGVGQIRWCDVALHLPGRIGKQCRERWCNHLDSTIRKGHWTPQEDDTVFKLQQTIGNKWSEIAKHLPGRTENAVKNRFNSAARRKWIMSQAHAANAAGTVQLTSSRSSTTGTGKAPRRQQQRHRQSPLGRGGVRVSLPRNSGGFLPIDLLAGPPRPPPLPPRGVAYSPPSSGAMPVSLGSLDGTSGGGGFRHAVEPSPPASDFAFGDSDASSYFPPSDSVGSSDFRPSFSFHPNNAFPFRPQFLSANSASLTTMLSPPSFAQDKACEPEEPVFSAQQDGLGLGRAEESEDNQQTHSPARRSSISSASDRGDMQRRFSVDASSLSEGNEEGEGDDNATLRAIDLPDSDAEGPGAVVTGGSPVDMDDQNMSTFLDSVALELDDML
jgi:hypothetical protein